MVRRESPARPTGKLDPVATWPGGIPEESRETLSHAETLYRRRPITRFASHREQSVPFALSNFEFHQPGTFPGAPAPGKCVPWCGRWWCSRLTRGMPTPQARQDTLLSSFFLPSVTPPPQQHRLFPPPCTDGGRFPRFASHRVSRVPPRSPTRSPDPAASEGEASKG